MNIYMECIGCRKIKKFSMFEKYPVCLECRTWEEERRERMNNMETTENICPLCDYSGGAMENHHVDGRKNSDRTIRICANCHSEIHAGVRILT